MSEQKNTQFFSPFLAPVSSYEIITKLIVHIFFNNDSCWLWIRNIIHYLFNIASNRIVLAMKIK